MPNREGTSRRDFVKGAMIGAGSLLLRANQTEAAEPGDRLKILAALCETIIPSKPDDPGFKDLEPYGIIEEVNRSLRPLKDEMFVRFNEASKTFFQNRSFLELDEGARAEFLKKVIRGEVTDKAVRNIYRFTRMAALRVYYSNFPKNKIPRDANGIPILKSGETHQITSANSKTPATGWNVAGYRGPLTWEQEEKMRAEAQKTHWHDPDNLEALIVRYRAKST